mgnify:CR=1 FL=1
MSLKKNSRRIPIKRKGAAEQEQPTSAEEANAKKQDRMEERETMQRRRDADAPDWRTHAARLKAELDRCYQRQDQRIETHVQEQQADFLRSFLPVVENLENALAHMERDDGLFAGVKATYESMLALLRRHDVTPIRAQDQPFDPLLHEAVGFVPAAGSQDVPLQVQDVTQRGYRRGDRVLRPARVIVAQRMD